MVNRHSLWTAPKVIHNYSSLTTFINFCLDFLQLSSNECTWKNCAECTKDYHCNVRSECKKNKCVKMSDLIEDILKVRKISIGNFGVYNFSKKQRFFIPKISIKDYLSKLRYYEKATKFENISHLFWQNSCFYSVTSKQVGDFFKFLWPFQKSWTLQ